LADQALASKPETSFLPLYYSCLNLFKIYLLLAGKRVQLEANRWHGAKYLEGEMGKNYLNQQIQIFNRGTIPLIYSTMLGKAISTKNIKIRLGDLYSQIFSISAEYELITKKPPTFFPHLNAVVRDDTNGHYFQVSVISDQPPSAPKAGHLKA